MLVENPLLQPGLRLVQREIPVLGGSPDERVAGFCVVGIDKFLRREGGAAFLALVAIGVGVMASGAFALDVAVGEEVTGLFVVELLSGLLHQLAFVEELAEEVAGHLVMSVAGSAAIHIKTDAEAFKRLFDEVVIAVHYLLGGDALLACADSHGHTVLVAAAYEYYILAPQA